MLYVSVIEIEDIVEHIDGHSKPLVDSKLILKAGYLQRVGLVQETAEYSHVRGVCILVSNPGKESCEINLKIRKPFPGTVGFGHCTCNGGSTGKCKHAVAVLRTLMT